MGGVEHGRDAMGMGASGVGRASTRRAVADARLSGRDCRTGRDGSRSTVDARGRWHHDGTGSWQAALAELPRVAQSLIKNVVGVPQIGHIDNPYSTAGLDFFLVSVGSGTGSTR